MEKITLVLGSKRYSSWSLRPWLAARTAGLAFDEQVIDLKDPDRGPRLRAASPTGLVPVLRMGEFVLPDSLAICELIAELAPEAQLWPEDRLERARARAVACEMHSGFAALRHDCPMDVVERHPGRARSAQAEADIARVQALWAACRARPIAAEGPFLFGRFSVADAMFAPVCTRFHTYHVPMDEVAAAYVAAVFALPAMQEWIAAARAEG